MLAKNGAVVVHVRMVRREDVIGPGRDPGYAGRCRPLWGRRTSEEKSLVGSGGLGLHREYGWPNQWLGFKKLFASGAVLVHLPTSRIEF